MSRLLRVPVAGLSAGRMQLVAETSHYVFRVHRRLPGDRLLLFDPQQGREAIAEINEDRSLTVSALRVPPQTTVPVRLLQGVGKSAKPEQVVKDATALGVQEVVFLRCERSVAKSQGGTRGERIRRVSVEAARQSYRSDVPEILGPLPFEEGLSISPASWASPTALRLMGLVGEGSPGLAQIIYDKIEAEGSFPTIDLLIGPEGGLSENELERAGQAGFISVSLGPLVLRTETAATASLGFLRMVAEWAHDSSL